MDRIETVRYVNDLRRTDPNLGENTELYVRVNSLACPHVNVPTADLLLLVDVVTKLVEEDVGRVYIHVMGQEQENCVLAVLLE